jgi:pheromone alpha factor receptor
VLNTPCHYGSSCSHRSDEASPSNLCPQHGESIPSLVAGNNVRIIVSGSFQSFAQEFLGAPASDGNIFECLVIGGIIFQLLLYMSIIATLGLQVQVVFSVTKGERWQLFITIILSITGFALFAFELAYCVFFINFVVAQNPVPVTAVRVLFVVFVDMCSLVFLYKLGIAIRQRRRIGIAKFGPLQILFIMSCQCLVAPRKSIFSA